MGEVTIIGAMFPCFVRVYNEARTEVLAEHWASQPEPIVLEVPVGVVWVKYYARGLKSFACTVDARAVVHGGTHVHVINEILGSGRQGVSA